MGRAKGHKDQTVAKKGSTGEAEADHIHSISCDTNGRPRGLVQDILENSGTILVARTVHLRSKDYDSVRALHRR
jgi:hypothetical protein